MKKRLLSSLLILILILIYLPSGVNAEETASSVAGDYIQGMIDMVKDSYSGKVTEQELINGALKGLFGSMDPYTEFFTLDEANDFISTIEGTYVGIGVVLSIVNGQVMITNVFPGSPAETAGILQGDKIVSIEGKELSGKAIEEVTGLIKGEKGTAIKLTIQRENSKEFFVKEVIRGEISISPISYEIYDNIGYIRIDMFSSNTDEYLTKALKYMDENCITKIVLDLRNNPGGELYQAVETARKFIPRGIVTKVDYKSEDETDRVYYSYLPAKKYAVSVLVNGLSASASEIVAGAIQDSGTGLLIGTKTFGKAKVQSLIPVLTPQAFSKYQSQTGKNEVNAYDLMLKYSIIPFTDEILGYAKITTGVYTTPKGTVIDLKGIRPDIAVADTEPVNGIYPGSIPKLSKTAKYGSGSESPEVYYAEMILSICGYDVDKPDYRLDDKTFEAVARFQEDYGLFPYGVLDFSTQQALNDTLRLRTLELDKQLGKAIEVLSGR